VVSEPTELTFRGRRVARDRALVMAIVNRTPDSFYDKGATFSDHSALAAVDRAVTEGADIVDIGGVKAGPGTDVDVDEEIRRVVPFVEEIRHRHSGVPSPAFRRRDQRRHLASRSGATGLRSGR
jgi:dihydropteroate synthase